jgi:hypothetical protein
MNNSSSIRSYRAMSLRAVWCLVCSLGIAAWALSQDADERRAELPTWDELPPGIFFRDAFREGLRGPRPESLQSVRPTSQQPAPAGDPGPSSGTENNSTGNNWAQLIAASSIEDEIKAIKRHCDEALKSEGYFKGQGYREIRQHLGTAAILFAIIDQYPGSIRWKSHAPTARLQFARVAQNTKVGSSQVFREANARRQDLADLIQGASIAEQPAEEWSWPAVADRKLIMQRLELAVHDRLGPVSASPQSVTAQQTLAVREAELVAALAHALVQEGMDEATDDEYMQYCRELQEAARAFAEAVKAERYEDARQAHGTMKNSCVSCHELYRA